VSIVGPSEARPADGLAVDFVVESDRAQLSEIVQRVRDGRLRTNIGTVSTLDDAVAAFNPTKRISGRRSSAFVRERHAPIDARGRPALSRSAGCVPISPSHKGACMAFTLKINGTPP
jgi:hypothetical protein